MSVSRYDLWYQSAGALVGCRRIVASRFESALMGKVGAGVSKNEKVRSWA